jgi:peptide/nickel transport system ATP-binding protein
MDTNDAGATPAPLLALRELRVSFATPEGRATAVDGISFQVGRGERVGVVGESGSGKSLTGLSLLGLTTGPGVEVSGELAFDGTTYDLATAATSALRGRGISMIFQEPMTALDPVYTVGSQIGAVIRHHRRVSRRAAREAAIDALRAVNIPDPVRRYDDYPHQMSGGMRQRAMIAMAIACEPQLIIADEPTTALDVTTQAQILELLTQLSEERHMAVLLISHDLGVIAESCQRLVCVYAGQVVERATTDEALLRPRHPYLAGLLAAIPRAEARGRRLQAIPGTVPAPARMPIGCRFAPRCPHAAAGCTSPQEMRPTRTGAVRCGRHEELTLPGVLELEHQ